MSARTHETLTREEFHARLKAQGVPREHLAFRCWMCGTLQSLKSFEGVGVAADLAERQIGYSCVGRHTNAGAWDSQSPARRAVPGCDWTLGGLLGGGALRIVEDDGGGRWCFALATPAEAAALRARDGRLAPPDAPDAPEAT